MLFLDARVLTGWAAQSLLAIPTALILWWCSKTLPSQERALPWLCVVVSTGFEILGSLVWKGYHYRLGNVPLFVPFGHGLIYVFGATLAATPFVRKNVDLCARTALALALLWAVLGITALPHVTSRVDVHGLVWLPLFAAVLLSGPRRAFFAALFLATSEVEIFGTWFGNWLWAPMTPWFHVPSGNPPSAIAAGYAVIDGSMLYVSSLFRSVPRLWTLSRPPDR
ncbi:MAG TPA: hypothetical protein VKT72_08545 [Candidatus Baltobacteraceae bacterium]|nr:hypothetical protein [Candidatus Baltobacteraceae bacterium]